MINGMPGKMATEVYLLAQERGVDVVPYSLTGPDISERICFAGNIGITLIKPQERFCWVPELRRLYPDLACVDFTHPDARKENVERYCEYGFPFVMGTTGKDGEVLEQIVRDSGNIAVIAPNMAKQIVAFMDMMGYAAEQFPLAFSGYTLEIVESHQNRKADTSGTARAMARYFNDLGVPFTVDQIEMIRDPAVQEEMGIPHEFLPGHAWHTYRLLSEDGSVLFSFTHNVNGRRIYAEGTLDAMAFLEKKVAEGAQGKVFTMMDVLRG